MKVRAEILVGGRVQGVGFRWFVVRSAVTLGVTGYTENLANGDVLTIAEGDAGAVAELAEMLRHGPPRANVLRHTVRHAGPTDEFHGFTVRDW